MMKKYCILWFSLLLIAGCTEDEWIDPTVLPAETTTGAHTFGCLIDGWVYVGGRYFDPFSGIPSIEFSYYPEEDKVSVSVRIKPDTVIYFTINHPVEGLESPYTEARLNNEPLPDGIVQITRFDQNALILSGRFSGGRITHGRFDVKFEEYRLE
jgi:hypothetical protein